MNSLPHRGGIGHEIVRTSVFSCYLHIYASNKNNAAEVGGGGGGEGATMFAGEHSHTFPGSPKLAKTA
jgi:hypothetical protein